MRPGHLYKVISRKKEVASHFNKDSLKLKKLDEWHPSVTPTQTLDGKDFSGGEIFLLLKEHDGVVSDIEKYCYSSYEILLGDQIRAIYISKQKNWDYSFKEIW